MMKIEEKLQSIKSLRKQKEIIIRIEHEQMKPVINDLSLISSYYRKFNEVANPKNKDNTKMFVFLMFFLYSPVSCIGRSVRGGVRKTIAKLLQVSNAAVSIQFGDAKVLFEKHCGFRKETEYLYQAIMSE